MAIIEEQGPDTRSSTSTTASRTYNVFGTSDEVQAQSSALLLSPGNIGGLNAKKITSLDEVNSEDPSGGHFVATIQWSTSENSEPKSSSFDYRFSFQAPSAHIYQSLETVASTAASGSAPDFGGAINVVNDSGKLRVEGFSIASPPETFSLSYHLAKAATPSYQMVVESLVGAVNVSPWKSRPAGSLMLSRVSGGGPNGNVTSIDFGFSFVANKTSLDVGGITVPSKDGHDLLWAYYHDKVDTNANLLVKKPLAVYVERVRPRMDFNLLGF